MKIVQKRIRNVERYLVEFKPGEELYLAAQLTEDEYKRISQKYGLKQDDKERIPIPRGTYSARNANGQWKLLRDQPKEPRVFEHYYHAIDWHGQHHYGICHQMRMCFKRKLIPPLELRFSVEDHTLYSSSFKNSPEEYAQIQLAINLMLEMVGNCETQSAESKPANVIEQVKIVPWEILRAGTKDKDELKAYIEKTLERKNEGQVAVIRERHGYLQGFHPDFYAVGSQNFFGYVVYGFSSLRLYVFECNQPNNATYIFSGDWQTASQLTKTEILDGHIQDARVFHTQKWHENLRQAIVRHNRRAG